MLLHDLVILGRTVPEESHKYGVRVCLAGHSEQLGGLVRVYPVLVDAPLKSRHRAILAVERNPQDSRQESYKLLDAVGAVKAVSPSPVLSTAAVTALAERHQVASIAELNRGKLSLGFVAVRGRPVLEWHTKDTCADPRQLSMLLSFQNDLRVAQFLTGKDYARVPYLTFHDREGKHSLQLREWGCFEYLRQCDGTVNDLHERLRLADPRREWFVLVGNMTPHRNVWLVIQLFSRLRLADTLWKEPV